LAQQLGLGVHESSAGVMGVVVVDHHYPMLQSRWESCASVPPSENVSPYQTHSHNLA
jgi:hypothetical protein